MKKYIVIFLILITSLFLWNESYTREKVSTVGLPAGMVITFAGTTCPDGFFDSDGSSKSKTTYPLLHAAIGYTYGGSGDNFNIPDYRGMFLRGTGTHGTLQMANGSAFAGPAIGSNETDQFQSFTVTGSNTSKGIRYMTDRAITNTSNSSFETWDFTTGSTAPLYFAASGGNGTPRNGDETRPVAYGVKYCIKY